MVDEDFSVDNVKKSELYHYVYDFQGDYGSIGTDDILTIQKYLMKKHGIKKC